MSLECPRKEAQLATIADFFASMGINWQSWFGELKFDGEILKFKSGALCHWITFGKTNRKIELPINVIYKYKLGRTFPGCRILTLYIGELTLKGELRVLRLKPINVTFVDRPALKELIRLLDDRVAARANNDNSLNRKSVA